MKSFVNHANSSINLSRRKKTKRGAWSNLLLQINALTNNTLQYLQSYFNQGLEPKIWQKRDRFGNLYWVVYEPSTGHSSSFGSEQEVRVWLEQRYYRS